MKSKKLSHIQIIALGYFIMIAVGTALLTLPVASRANEITNPLTALFTATSASCVTGLVLKDTSTYWSIFGQLVIIILIQIGGLGFMTIATFFFKIMNKKTGIRERAVMAESINTTRLSDLSSLTKKIIAGTAAFELTGAALMSIRFIPRFGVLKGIYFSLFHSVSAFCNAGFDLMGVEEPYSSFTHLSDDILINTVLMILIIIGGIGFLVWEDVARNRFKFKKFCLHTKTVITVTAILVFGGALLLYLFESKNLCEGMSIKEKILTSLFGSVTARTAGFNTVDTGALTPASKLLTIALMFIGGSSGSTAGGIKTTTIAVIFISMISAMRGKANTDLFGRSIKDEILKKAAIILSINFILAFTGTLIICAFQDLSLSDSMFEAFSAIGTVGMTTGVTRNLNTISKTVIIFLMYCGRVGSISFAVALFNKKSKPPVNYPFESVTVG